MIADEAIINEIRQTNRLLKRIADVLDVMALEQGSLHQTVEKLLDSEEKSEQDYQIPGFDVDPLEGFPSIRKDRDSGVPFVAIGNNEPIPENLPEYLKKHLREARGEE